MPSTLVIYNPIAGHGRVQAHWLLVKKALHQADVAFDAVAIRAPLDAMILAEQAPQKYSAVVGIGGDGTVHEIVNGLMRASGEGETIAMGVVPLGNGNDFAKVIPPDTPIDGKLFDWRAAVHKIARMQTQLFDAGRILGDHLRPEMNDVPHYFMNGMDVGFGAQSALNFRTLPKFLTGMSAYLAAVLKTMIDYRIPHVRIQLDDQRPFEQSTTMTAITNGRCLGNGFWVCPDARADDGLFDVDDGGIVALLPCLLEPDADGLQAKLLHALLLGFTLAHQGPLAQLLQIFSLVRVRHTYQRSLPLALNSSRPKASGTR